MKTTRPLKATQGEDYRPVPLENCLTSDIRDNSVPALVSTSRSAAVNAPPRKRRPQRVKSFLATWEHAPQHIRDNKYILRGYRAGYNFKSSLLSVFNLHNETGNIWTHLIGFLIFIFLTVLTIHLRPAPLRLGAEAFAALESRLANLNKQTVNPNLYELFKTAGAWERAAFKYGAEHLHALENKLRGIGRHNIGEELSSLLDSLKSQVGNFPFGGAKGISRLESRLEAGWSALSSELAALPRGAIREVEMLLHRALATTLDPKQNAWPANRWPLYVFTAGAMICLLTSSVCHIFGCCAAHITSVMWRFDYAGIAVLIVASFFPPVYYGFLCQPVLRLVYLTTTALLGASTMTVTLMSKFQTPEYHAYRAALFAGLGLWGIVPMTHGLIINNGIPEVATAMRLDVIMGALYLLGAAIYAYRVPERWKPGAFDVAFHSHQLFHVAVVVAAMIHYRASMELLHWRDATGGCLEFNQRV